MNNSVLLKKMLFNAVIVLLVPAMLVVFEVVLRVVGYGYSTEPFIRHQDLPEIYSDNPKYRHKYFPSQSGLEPVAQVNVFDFNKSSDTLRGFIVGGSSAQGYPFETNHSFSKILEKALQSAGKFRKVEIVNLGMSAMSSYYDRDSAIKALNYQPDFLVVYSGHNEYYGTVSYSTGGSFEQKNVYLFLKEFRTFQLFFELLNGGKSQSLTESQMAIQYDNRTIPSDTKIDEEVATVFVNNVAAIVSEYSRRGIPVIVAEPVSNLFDMPPFAGQADKTLNQTVKEYSNEIRTQDLVSIQKRESDPRIQASLQTNANIMYLTAAANSLLGRNAYDLFVRAKDNDIVPFRARSTLSKRLTEYLKKFDSPLVSYIATSDQIGAQFGVEALSNTFFVDHLHFNFTGNKILASLVAEKVSAAFNFSEKSNKIMETFLNSDDQIRESIHLLPLPEEIAYQSLEGIFAFPPYSTMLVPYRGWAPPKSPSSGILSENVAQAVKAGDKNQAYSRLYSELSNKRDIAHQKEYFDQLVYVRPTNFEGYLASAKFYGLVLMDIEKATQFFTQAYRLSHRSKAVYDEMFRFFYATSKRNVLDLIIAQYGSPN